MSQAGVPDPNLRASDADRERIVEQLRQHTADGRLTMDEFEQRMAAAYAAKTYGELAQLTRDLPVDLGARSRGAGFGPPPPQDAPPWSGGSWPRKNGADTSATGNEVVDAVIGAAMNWKMQRIAVREQMRAPRHQARLARRAGAPIASGFVGWAVLSTLLTVIWFMHGVTSGNGFGDFWPIWPIGILGFLTVLKAIKTVALRRELTRR